MSQPSELQGGDFDHSSPFAVRHHGFANFVVYERAAGRVVARFPHPEQLDAARRLAHACERLSAKLGSHDWLDGAEPFHWGCDDDGSTRRRHARAWRP